MATSSFSAIWNLSATPRLRPIPDAPEVQRLDSLRQTSLRRSLPRAGISGALHAPRRHQQSAPVSSSRWPSILRLDRLPRQSPQGHDRVGSGVHPPLPAAQPAHRFPAHSLLRLSGQLPSRRQTHPLPETAGHTLFGPAAQSGRLSWFFLPDPPLPALPDRNHDSTPGSLSCHGPAPMLVDTSRHCVGGTRYRSHIAFPAVLRGCVTSRGVRMDSAVETASGRLHRRRCSSNGSSTVFGAAVRPSKVPQSTHPALKQNPLKTDQRSAV